MQVESRRNIIKRVQKTKNKKNLVYCLTIYFIYVYAEYNFLFLNYAWIKLNILLSFCFSDYYRI